MLEVLRARTAVVVCCAGRAALDELEIDGALSGRVAPDELLLLGALEARDELLRAADEQLAAHDGALVVDQTDAWVTFGLRGAEREVAFARLSAVPLPQGGPAFVQGAVAGLAAKVVVADDILYVLVGSTVGHHLHDRILTACSDLEMHEPPAEPFAVERPAREAAAAGGAE